MSDKSRSGRLIFEEKLDAIGDEFESTWSLESSSNGIEEFVRKYSGDVPVVRLIHELVELDIDLRARQGDVPLVIDYRMRFEQIDAQWLQRVIAAKLQVHGQARDPLPNQESIHDTLPRIDQVDIGTSKIGNSGHERDKNLAKPKPEIPTHVNLPDYEILSEISRGGMGVVYKAKQKSLNRVVAVKMILSGRFASPQERTRFRTEAEATARLDHPGIVPVYEVGENDGHPYYSMAFVDGANLQKTATRRPLTPTHAARLTLAIAEAVAYAHRNGVIHRDLKPANILVDSENGPRITDFGLAKAVGSDSSLTAAGQVLGTPGYMSPEQAEGDSSTVDERADIYSIGAILYFLLTSRPPFQAATVKNLLVQITEKEPVKPRQLDESIPEELEAICLTCLNKDPKNRYQSARKLANDLQKFLAAIDSNVEVALSQEQRPTWSTRRLGLYAIVCAVSIVGILAVATQFAGNAPKVSDNVEIEFFEVRQVGRDAELLPLNEDKPLRSGDYIRFDVDLSEPAYVRLLFVDSTGIVQEVYPNDPQEGYQGPGPVAKVNSPVNLKEGWPLENLEGSGELVLLLVNREPFEEAVWPKLEWNLENQQASNNRYFVSRSAAPRILAEEHSFEDATRGIGTKSGAPISDEADPIIPFLEKIREYADWVCAERVPTDPDD